MPNRRSPGKLEHRKARNYAYQHCRVSPEKDEIKEIVFAGTPEELEAAVLSVLQGERTGAIPELPQGLVLSDSHGEGFFDNPINIPV